MSAGHSLPLLYLRTRHDIKWADRASTVNLIGGDADCGAQFRLHGGPDGMPADADAAFWASGQCTMIVTSQGLVMARGGFGGRAVFKISKFAAHISDRADEQKRSSFAVVGKWALASG